MLPPTWGKGKQPKFALPRFYLAATAALGAAVDLALAFLATVVVVVASVASAFLFYHVPQKIYIV